MQSVRFLVGAVVVAAGALVAVGHTARAAAAPRVTGVYSSLAYNAEGSDLLGMELFVVAGPGGYYATVQCAGGEPARPVVVPVRVSGAQLAFTLPAGEPECGTSFVGVVSAAGLPGTVRRRDRGAVVAAEAELLAVARCPARLIGDTSFPADG